MRSHGGKSCIHHSNLRTSYIIALRLGAIVQSQSLDNPLSYTNLLTGKGEIIQIKNTDNSKFQASIMIISKLPQVIPC
jgi:hypothetical protein